MKAPPPSLVQGDDGGLPTSKESTMSNPTELTPEDLLHDMPSGAIIYTDTAEDGRVAAVKSGDGWWLASGEDSPRPASDLLTWGNWARVH